MADPQDFLKRLEALQGQRKNHDSRWQRVKDLVWPDGDEFTVTRSAGETTTNRIYDMTAAAALEKFASAMESFLIPRHIRWHGLRATSDALMKDKEVKEFFEALVMLLFKARENPKARFYSQMHENLKSLGAYGNGCIFLDEPDAGRGLQYRHIPVGKAWVATNHVGAVDSVFYKYSLSAKAAAQKWPHAVPPRAAMEIERGTPMNEAEYLHVVIPNAKGMIDPESVRGRNMAFLSYDVAIDDKAFIPQPGGDEEGGFHEMPYLWSRYTLNPNETYGRGPGELCLPDIQTLQEMEKTMMRSGHKVADPPLLVAHDGRLGRGQRKIRLEPGGLNYGAVDEAGRAKILPLQTGARLDITLELMDRKRDTIHDFFLVKLFDILAQDRVEMTATEVLERSKEKGQLVTPVVGRQQTELLGPMIERELAILQRQGALPPMPMALVEARGEYEIQYDTLATRMQQSDEVAAYQRLIEVFAPQANLDPTLLEVLNAERAMRTFGETMGIRSTLFKTENEMEQIRQAQAEQLQAQMQAEQQQQQAAAAKDAATAGAMMGKGGQ